MGARLGCRLGGQNWPGAPGGPVPGGVRTLGDLTREHSGCYVDNAAIQVRQERGSAKSQNTPWLRGEEPGLWCLFKVQPGRLLGSSGEPDTALHISAEATGRQVLLTTEQRKPEI